MPLRLDLGRYLEGVLVGGAKARSEGAIVRPRATLGSFRTLCRVWSSEGWSAQPGSLFPQRPTPGRCHKAQTNDGPVPDRKGQTQPTATRETLCSG